MWRKIPTDGDAPIYKYRSDRLKVAGGWLVRTITGEGNDAGTCVVQTFVSDPLHAHDPAVAEQG